MVSFRTTDIRLKPRCVMAIVRRHPAIVVLEVVDDEFEILSRYKAVAHDGDSDPPL